MPEDSDQGAVIRRVAKGSDDYGALITIVDQVLGLNTTAVDEPVEHQRTTFVRDRQPTTKDQPPRGSYRDERIRQLRSEGRTLQEIASAVGLSRERIRQILASGDGAPTAKELKERAAAERMRMSQEATELVADDITANPGSTYAEVALRTGMSEHEVRSRMPSALRKLVVERNAADLTIWRDDEIFAALRLAQTFEFPLTTSTYEMLVRRGEVKGASVPRLSQRFGSWRHACALAGVETTAPNRPAYESRWTDSDLLEFVCDYLEGPDSAGTFAGYDAWAREQLDAPSAATVRNRLGDWGTTKKQVFDGIWRRRHAMPPKTRATNAEDAS